MSDATKPGLSLEVLEARIDALEAKLEAQGANANLWDQHALAHFKQKREEWYGVGGGHTDEDDAAPVFEFSPPEVVELEGWQNIQPRGFGDLPKKYQSANPFLGLDVSRSRSCGCVFIKNQYESAILWRDHPEAVAEFYRRQQPTASISERLIRMAGHAMADWRVMLPTAYFAGAYDYIDDYTWTPEGAPFNEDEESVYRLNVLRAQDSGMGLAMAGADLLAFPLYNGDERVGERYLFLHVFNHPQWVLPAVMELYNSGNFKRRQYRAALTRAHAIDNEQRVPVPGYGSWQEFGSFGSYQDFCSTNERSAQPFTPLFQAKAEDIG